MYDPDIKDMCLQKVRNLQTSHHNFLCGHLRSTCVKQVDCIEVFANLANILWLILVILSPKLSSHHIDKVLVVSMFAML